MPTSERPGRQKRLIRAGARIVLFGAFLPNFLFLGHWPIDPGGDHHFHTPAEAEAHAAHCHTSASQCAGESAMVGTFWNGDDAAPIAAGGPLRQIERRQREPLQEPDLAIDTPPPRFA